MAEILTRTYKYTGVSSWTVGESAVKLSQFTKSGSTRPITQILSISASWSRKHVTSSTVVHAAELVFSGGTTLTSTSVSKRGDGKIFGIETNFVEIPSASSWTESSITLRTTLNTKQSQVYWQASSSYPMTLTITYLSSEFKPSITDAKIYRASSTGAASDSGTHLTFTAKLAVEKTGTSGSGILRIYSGSSASGASKLVYTETGISGSTSGNTVSAAPISGLTVGSGEKKWFRMEFSYTATANGVSSTETVSAAFLIGNVFTNVHLAGKKNGGVAFGKYSASTDDTPMFECNYPAYFYGGIAQIGDGSGDLLALIGVQHGSVDGMTLTGSTTNTLEVSFPRAFKSAPNVVATFDSSSVESFTGRWDYLTLTVANVTATGFTLRVHNGTSTTFTPGIRWIAVGTPAN